MMRAIVKRFCASSCCACSGMFIAYNVQRILHAVGTIDLVSYGTYKSKQSDVYAVVGAKYSYTVGRVGCCVHKHVGCIVCT